MANRLSWLVVLLGAALPVCAANTGSISGVVKNANGIPQMGASVEVFAIGALQPLITYTGKTGAYESANLVPGRYLIKVSAASFLPTLVQNVVVRSGSRAVINVTLSTLAQAMRLLPPRQTSPQDADDWKWTLRSAANRPILRFDNDLGLVLASVARENSDAHGTQGTVAFVAGSQADGFGGASDYGTSFDVRQALFTGDTLTFDGSVGNGNGTPSGVVRASYKHAFADGETPNFAVTLRHSAPTGVAGVNSLSSVAWTFSNQTNLAGIVDLSYGSEMQEVQFIRHINGFRPFATATVHLGDDTLVEYRYATAEPSSPFDRALGNASDDDSAPAPHLSVVAAAPALERDRHQEIAVSRKDGNNKLQAAVYFDHVSNVALTGSGDVSSLASDVIPDYFSDTFTFNGGNLETRGVRLVAAHTFAPEFTALLDYAFGGTVAAPDWNTSASWADVRDQLRVEDAHSVTGKLTGVIPESGTKWTASYKWISSNAVTPVDMFNASAGEADPYFSIIIRQRIPGGQFFPGHIEALVDVRNLLAQGYRPFLSPDGRTLYLVQSARAVRGGLAFTF
ncbi:MAG TPA: TonB-dependent receptor [Terriglobales bacterium]|nr:TonB-dependent receptor [Terriglobales bacterium]